MKLIIFIFIALSVVKPQTVKAPENKIRTEIKYSGSQKIFEVKVYGNSGELKFKIEKELPSKETAPYAVPVDNGGVILVDVLEGNAEFFNSEGIKVKSVSLFEGFPFAYERKVQTAASNGFVVFLVSQKERENSVVKIFDVNGRLINEFEVKGTNGSGVEILPDKKLIAISTYYWRADDLIGNTSIFDFDGKPLMETPHKFDNGKFSQEGKYFLGFDKHKIFLLDTENKITKWSRSFPENEFILVADFKNNKVITVTSTESVLENGVWYNKIAIVRESNLKGADEILTILNNKKFKKVNLIITNNKITLVLDEAKFVVR